MTLPELVNGGEFTRGLVSAFTVRRRNRWCKGNQLRGEKRKMMSVGSGEHRSLVVDSHGLSPRGSQTVSPTPGDLS